MEPGRRAIVKEFYTNLGERKDMTCYVSGEVDPIWGKDHHPNLEA